MIDQMVSLIISETEDQLISTIFVTYPSDRQLLGNLTRLTRGFRDFAISLLNIDSNLSG